MKQKTDAMREVVLFFALTLGLSWVFWGPIVLFKIPTVNVNDGTVGPPWALLLFLLGGATPSLSGIILTWRKEGRAGLRNLWRRFTQFNIGLRWYVAILLVVTLEALGQLVIVRSLGEAFNPSLLLSRAGMLVTLFFAGPLLEEIGWRGYALDRLQSRWNALTSSLILGVIWGVWHLPSFLMVGAIQHEWNMSFVGFVVRVTSISVLNTWLHNNTGRSIWTAVIFHWIGSYPMNIFTTYIPRTTAYNWLEPIPHVLIATLVVSIWGAQTLTSRKRKARLELGGART